MRRDLVDVLKDVVDERRRQDNKWGSQRHLDGPLWSAILSEEVGEAAQALLERETDHLREELVQVAAVAVAWIEAIDSGRGGTR